MPIYEYICESCGNHCEFWQGITEDPKTECPECGKPTLKRIISMTSFQLKGSGWYVTDYAGKTGASSGGNGAKHDANGTKSEGNGSGESKSGESKTETATKSEAKAESASSKSSD